MPVIARLAGAVSLLAALLPSRAALSQTGSFAFERIARERGLSNGSVTAIAQDGHGFLWVGTQDGLNQYDGSTFRIFRPIPGDTASLADAWISGIVPAQGGILWIGTLHGGLQRFDPRSGKAHQFRHDPANATSIVSNEVNTLLLAKDGTIWLGTSAGLDAVDTASGRARHFLPAPSGDSTRQRNDVLSLAELPGSLLAVGTRRGLYLFDRALGTFRELQLGLHTLEIRGLDIDARGIAWVGTRDDLLAANLINGRVVRHDLRGSANPSNPAAAGVNAIDIAGDGTIWIASDDGIVALGPAGSAVTRHTFTADDPRSLGGPIVRSLFIDRSGILWAGTESYGLSKHAPAAITFDLLRADPRNPRALSDEYIRGMTQDRAGNVWIATQNGGLDRLDAATGRVRVYRHNAADPSSLPGDNVWSYFEDHTGTAWVGLHERGFGTFDTTTGRFTPFAGIPADGSVNVVYEDREGRLYVGLEGRGLYEISNDRSRVISYGATTGDERILANDDVQSILEDRKGRLWIGGADGLTRINRRTGRVTRYQAAIGHPGALSSSFVTSIIEDSRGWIWIATKGGGIDRFDDRVGGFVTYGTAQGLPHSFIYGILEDGHGNLWLSSDDGIAMFDPTTGFVTHYGLADGLQAREFNRRAFLRTRDGTMYFGGINGVNVFHPDVIAASAAPPAISLVTLETNRGRRSAIELSSDSTVTLPHDANAVTISFAALDFTAPEKIRYAYKLDGVDRDWVIAAADQHQATYASLPTGRHVFRVIAAGPSGQWNRNGAGVSLLVKPAWWATPWAMSLELLALIVVTLGVMRLRLAADRRRRARELLAMTAEVPGAVFRLRETAAGSREFVFVSAGIARLFPGGHLPDAALGDARLAAEHLFGRFVDGERASLERGLAVSRETLDAWHAELRWTPVNATDECWLAVHARPERQSDGSTIWTGVMTDVTAAQRAEAERVALESKMLQAQKAESLAVLAGGVAHDFNNVLVSVVVGAELLEYQIGDNPRAAETIRRIRDAGYRASELTQQMLAYAGKGRRTVERVDLRELVTEMLSLVRATIPRTTEVEYLPCAEQAIVEIDATQLRQVVMNLVTNASEAVTGNDGHVTITVRIEHAPADELTLLQGALDMPAHGPYVVLEVADDGAGMEPSLLSRIFDPFFTTKFTGRGLGLAALLGIVRGHHGGLNVETAPGRGTTFSIYLPLSSGPVTATKQTPIEPPRATSAVRVLIADDEKDVRELARDGIRRLGYEVLLAKDGAEAVALAEANPDIGVFVIDLTMPRMDGAAATRALRESGVTAPIVLMSGYAQSDLLSRGVTAHADAFLRKPFLMSELASVLRDVTTPVTPRSDTPPREPS